MEAGNDEDEGFTTCLLQEEIDGNLGKIHVISKRKVYIGRCPKAEIHVSYFSVSRMHAYLEWFDYTGWCIQDNKSVNGVYIDGKKCASSELYPLRHGHKISLGPGRTNGVHLRFSLCSQLTMVSSRNEQTQSDYVPTDMDVAEFVTIPSEDSSLPSPEALAAFDFAITQQSNEHHISTNNDMLYESGYRDHCISSMAMQDSPDFSISNGCSMVNVTEYTLSSPSDEVSERAFGNERIIVEEPDDNDQPASEGNSPNFWKEFNDLKGSFEEIHQNLLKKKDQVKEMEKEIEVYQGKLTELNMALSNLGSQSDSKNLDQSKDFLKIVENELTCIICTELFIEASTLSCGHTFCSYCLAECRKMRDRCPICRKLIMFNVSRSLVLHNFMEKMFSKFGEAFRKRRKEIIEKRKELSRSKNLNRVNSDSDLRYEDRYVSPDLTNSFEYSSNFELDNHASDMDSDVIVIARTDESDPEIL